MATSFTVFSLGQLTDWDPSEGNTNLSGGAVNSALGTYGSMADPLYEDMVTLAPIGTAGGTNGAYNVDGAAEVDRFTINGGPVQTFDAAMVFNATITYTDGTTATITAMVFQDTNGNTYWAPETSFNADQAAIEAKPIAALTLTSPIYNGGNSGYNMTADRFDSMPLCLTKGARITCPKGLTRIEDLQIGDLVMTMDHGAQPILWIGQSTVAALGAFAPIRIAAGALQNDHDMEVSPQHRMFIASPQAEVLFGCNEVLVAAKHLCDGAQIAPRIGGEVTYYHLLFDHHDIIWADGCPTETLFLGDASRRTLDDGSLAEIAALFPGFNTRTDRPHELARPTLKAYEARVLCDQMRPKLAKAA